MQSWEEAKEKQNRILDEARKEQLINQLPKQTLWQRLIDLWHHLAD